MQRSSEDVTEALKGDERLELKEYAARLRKMPSDDVVTEWGYRDSVIQQLGEFVKEGIEDVETNSFIAYQVQDQCRRRDVCAADIDRRRKLQTLPGGVAVGIDPTLIHEIKARVDLRALIEGFGISLKQRGKEFIGRCPFHDDRDPSLHVNVAKGLWHCFGCQTGGDAIAFLMRRDSIGFMGALRELAAYAGVDLPKRNGKTPPAIQAKSIPGTESRPVAEDNPPSIEQMIVAIPVDSDPVKLARALDPVLRRLAEMPRAEAQAILWHTLKPRFTLTYKDVQGYERALSESRRELKEHAARDAQAQAERERTKRHEETEREAAEHAQKLRGTKIALWDLHAQLRSVLGDLGDLLEIVLAVSAIPHVKPPVWLFVVGAPSSGKTELVRLLRASPGVYYNDTMTENAFVSGYVRPDGSDPSDLLPLLDGKTFVCKDLTTLFSLQEDTITKLLGDLSAIYDGEFRKHTATRGEVSYESSFAFIACITPAALNRHYRYLNMIGPRFLTYRVPPLTVEQVDAGFDVFWQNSNRFAQLDALRDAVSAYSFQASQRDIAEVRTDQAAREYLKRLSKLLARGRGVIVMNRTKFKDAEGQEREWSEVTDAQIEEPWRGYQQIEALARSLALVHQRAQVTAHELDLVRRVVLASMPPARGDALAHFSDPEIRERGYVVASEMGERIGSSTKAARNLLEELHALKLLRKEKVSAQAARYTPGAEFAGLIYEPRLQLDHVADFLGGGVREENNGKV